MVVRALLQMSLVLMMGAAASGQPATTQASGAPPKVGEVAPDFTLKDLEGNEVRLSEMAEDGPVVLVVLRGWPGYQCPICTKQVGELIGAKQQLAAADATVVLVYPGPAEGLKARAEEFMKDATLPENFRFVTDPGYAFTNAYGLRWDAPKETAYPSTFVMGPDRVVRFAKVSKTHGGRSSAAEVIKAVRAE